MPSPLQRPAALYYVRAKPIRPLGSRLVAEHPRREKTSMAAKPAATKDYDDIPGTFVFDAERSRQGYHLNMFCMSLMKEENRKAFKANEADYLNKFALTPE